MEIEPNNVSRPSNDFAGRFSEEPFSPGRPKADRGNHRRHGGADRVGLNRTAGSGDRRNSARASDPGHGVFVGAPPSSANQDPQYATVHPSPRPFVVQLNSPVSRDSRETRIHAVHR